MDQNSKRSLIFGLVSLAGVISLTWFLQNKKHFGGGKFPSAASLVWKSENQPVHAGKIVIIYGTTTGTGKTFALKLLSKLQAVGRAAEIVNMKDYDQEKLVKEDIALIIVSTWEGGVAPESGSGFVEDLRDYAYDFRVSKDLLVKLKYSVFGLGAELYGPNFGKAAVDIDEMLSTLGANAIAPVTLGDDASNLEERFGRWTAQLVNGLSTRLNEPAEEEGVSKRQAKKNKQKKEGNLKKKAEKGEAQDQYSGTTKYPVKNTKGAKNNTTTNVGYANSGIPSKAPASTGCCSTGPESSPKEGCCGGSGGAAKETKSSGGCGCNESAPDSNTLGLDPAYLSEEEEEDRINNNYVTMDHVEDEQDLHQLEQAGLLDLEDMGNAVNQSNASSNGHRQDVKDSLRGDGPDERREMVTKLQRKALTKEGYKIIGTHSAVKICRWTKNQLRGRGGCYKHSFYGITSYQCMEATPSLACANKCVFCWRHHKNPVGTEWRWKEDAPDMIVSEAVRLHQGMINEMRGVPGVQSERLTEAFTVKHCALSLVGEPIMYPRINEMLSALHAREISSFMVTNAQFPEHIKSLDPVTQLYVSVDASTRDSLKAIDRPLFK
eukprot:gene21473-24358_t